MPEVQPNQSWIDFSDLVRFLSHGVVGECRSKPSSSSTHRLRKRTEPSHRAKVPGNTTEEIVASENLIAPQSRQGNCDPVFTDCTGHNVGVEAIHRRLIHALQCFVDPIQSSTVTDRTFVVTHAEAS